MSIVSILAATTQSTAAENVTLEQALVCAGILIVIGAIAAAFGVFRPSKAVGPVRIPWNRPVWPFGVVLGLTAFIWFGVQVIYVTMRQATVIAQQGPQAHFDESSLTAGDLAILAAIPPLLAFVCMLIADWLVDRDSRRWLGLSLDRLPRGFGVGVASAVLAVPGVILTLTIAQFFYQKIGFQHPAEHEMLKAMGESTSPLAEWGLIFGVVIVAPLFEETFFRGHLQTLLRAGFVQLTVRRVRRDDQTRAASLATSATGAPSAAPFAGAPPLPAPPPDDWIIPPQDQPAFPPPPLAARAVDSVSPPGSAAIVYETPDAPRPPAWPVWQTWAAIALTSLAFASVHPIWMFPAIFTLSLVLGYLYERTGNLWVNIGLHATFNATSTFFYLATVRGH